MPSIVPLDYLEEGSSLKVDEGDVLKDFVVSCLSLRTGTECKVIDRCQLTHALSFA